MRVLALAAVVGLAVGCGGGTAVSPSPATGAPPTPTGVAATPSAPVTTSAAGGGTTVSVTISGGPDAGSYTGSDNPNCSSGLVGDGVWGVQYSTDAAGTGELSSVQLIAPADASSDASLTMTVTIGKLFEGNDYEISDSAGGSGSAQVTDNGATAVIHVTGTTADGVGLDVTVNCPSVIRV